MNNFDVLLGMKLGGGGGSSTLVEKTITANGTYNPADDNADGYSSVTANVPNTYTVADEGKVVDSGALVGQTAKSIDANGLYDTTLNNSVSVDVPNSYTVADEGKVVSQGDLVSQSAYPSDIDANGTYDTTLNNSVVVDVPNSYSAGDEGKVVSGGELVSQTSRTVSQNGTYDTTLNNSVTVNVTDPDFSPLAALLAGTLSEYSTEAPLSYTGDIGKYAVAYCNSLESVTLNNFILDNYAFANNDNLKQVSLGAGSVKGLYAFANTPMLQEIYVPSTVHYATPQKGSSMFKSSGLMRAVVDVSDGTSMNMFESCTKLKYAEVNGSSIESNSFSDCSILTNVVLSKCNSIGQTAFANCHELISITNSNHTACTIGVSAFSSCTALETVNFSNGFYSIGNSAFANCNSLRSIDLTGVTSIGNSAFANCLSLTSIILPDTLTSFGSGVFSGCKLITTAVLSNNISTLPMSTFQTCSSLTSIEIPSGVTSISAYAFNGCSSLMSIKFLGSTPPTVSNSNTWTGVPTTCKIYVPTGSLSAYTSASNYPDPNTYTYVEY